MWMAVEKPDKHYYYMDFKDEVSELALQAENKMIKFLWVDCCKVSLNFSGKFCIVMHIVRKEEEMIDVH